MVPFSGVATAQNADSKTEVLKWKDGKRAAFMLAFDDGCPSQLRYVVPELEKRKIPGTFYLVTGNNIWAAHRAGWEAAARSPYVIVANHTFTHQGVTHADQLEPELTKCNDVLYALHPERATPRLLAFATPGGVPWKVSAEELKAALAKHHLVDCPPFAGPPIHYKSAEELVAVVDRAIEKGEMGHLDMHGVGGDWLVTPLDWFIPLMDKLEKERDALWMTNPASLHKYTTEREGAEVRIIESNTEQIQVRLTAKTDPSLYDEQLTLSTRVPAGWQSCEVSQGASKSTHSVRDGAAQYSALPGDQLITLQRQ